MLPVRLSTSAFPFVASIFLGDISAEELITFGKKKDEFFREAALDLLLIPGVKTFLDSARDQQISIGLATSASLHARTPPCAGWISIDIFRWW
jgi:beta-phosphoglucomutase-like phosphatase (HAD superfamily)